MHAYARITTSTRTRSTGVTQPAQNTTGVWYRVLHININDDI